MPTKDDEEVISSSLFQYAPAYSIYYSSAAFLGSVWDPGQKDLAIRLEHSGRIIHLHLDKTEGILQDKWGTIGWMYFPTEDANPGLDYAFVIWNRV